MGNKEKAKEEIQALYDEVERKTEAILEKYKDYKGLDGSAGVEIRTLRKEFFKERDKILIKYGLPTPK